MPITAVIHINARNVAHPTTEDITKSPNNFFLLSSIGQKYKDYIDYTNKFSKKNPTDLWLGLKVEIDLIKIAVSTPPISNSDCPKSAYSELSTPCCVCDTSGVEGIRPCG